MLKDTTMHDESHEPEHQHVHSHSLDMLSTRRLAMVLGVTAAVLLTEVLGAVLSGSLALLADAGHMLVDSAGLFIALIVTIISRRPRTDTYTWGLARSEVVSAAFQSGMLLIVCVSIFVEAVERLQHPVQVSPGLMALFGALGLLGNIVSLLLLVIVRRETLNLRAAFLEVATDSLASAGVVLGAGLTYWAGNTRIDIYLSFLIAAVMAPRAILLLRQSLAILLERTPKSLDLDEIRSYVRTLPHVIDVHDLHISTISSHLVAVSLHVTLEDSCFQDGHALKTLHEIQASLASRFPISLNHSTIQLDSAAHRDHEELHHPGQTA